MSSVSGLGSATSSQLLQRLRDGQTGQADRMNQAFNTALQAMGVDSSKAASIIKQIQPAVEGAAKSSASASDPRAAMQQAVDGVLTKNGIDPQQFKTQFQAAMKKLGGNGQAPRSPQAKPAGGGPPPSAQAAPPKQATSTASTTSTTNTTETALEEAMESYAETLKEAQAGNQQAIKKLAAEKQAAAEKAQGTSARNEAEATGEAAGTTQGKERGIDMNA
jgi:hypothetical protein